MLITGYLLDAVFCSTKTYYQSAEILVLNPLLTYPNEGHDNYVFHNVSLRGILLFCVALCPLPSFRLFPCSGILKRNVRTWMEVRTCPIDVMSGHGSCFGALKWATSHAQFRQMSGHLGDDKTMSGH